MSRAGRPKPPAPDGQPKARRRDKNRTARSKISDLISDVQDPLISGDERKRGKRLDKTDATVDEAGQIRLAGDDIDLLH